MLWTRVLFHHHFIDLLFLFQTLRERHPSQKSRGISEEYGKRWIKFSVGEEPWEPYRLDGGVEEGKVMDINGRTGFEVWSWKEDEVEIAMSEEGERRYVGWEVIGEILGGIVKSHGVKAAEDVKWKWATDDGISD
jgi:hypothetical protein